MSDIKSYQRLLAVQALYEFTINKRGMDESFDELLSNIFENSDFKNKINNSSTGCNTCQHPEIQKHPAEIDDMGRHV